MTSTRLRPLAIAGAWAALILNSAQADDPPRPAPRLTVPPRPTAPDGSPTGSGGWWLGSAGIAGALAVFGGASLASRRFLPPRDSGPIRVVGRAALSSKHSVYLLRVGDRVLILGAGPQGPPSSLGEVTDPVELARLAPRRVAPRPAPEPASPSRPSSGFDRRIGGDE